MRVTSYCSDPYAAIMPACHARRILQDGLDLKVEQLTRLLPS